MPRATTKTETTAKPTNGKLVCYIVSATDVSTGAPVVAARTEFEPAVDVYASMKGTPEKYSGVTLHKVRSPRPMLGGGNGVAIADDSDDESDDDESA